MTEYRVSAALGVVGEEVRRHLRIHTCVSMTESLLRAPLSLEKL